MSKLSSKERNALPDSAFGLPKERKYPVEDKGHAAAAKSRAAHAEATGRISRNQEKQIDRKADRELGKGPAHGYGR